MITCLGTATCAVFSELSILHLILCLLSQLETSAQYLHQTKKVHVLTWLTKSYIKTCVIRPLKLDKTNILMTTGSSMKVESIAECILQYFWPAWRDNWSWTNFLTFWEWRLYTGFTVILSLNQVFTIKWACYSANHVYCRRSGPGHLLN